MTSDHEAIVPRSSPTCCQGGEGEPFAARRRRRVGSLFTMLPAVALVALPKCPLCVAGYLGVAGFGVAWLRAGWGLPLTSALLVAGVVAPVVAARRRRAYGPLFAAMAAVAAIVSAEIALDSRLLVCVGATLLAGASLWSLRALGAS
jgi:hypothetical protein